MMHCQVDISVVMPTMNKSGMLRRSLSALADQVLPPGVTWEVVVVNDGSTDDTADILLSLQDQFPVTLVVVAPGRNVGRAKARNLGLASASGRWVLFLDDDILTPPELLASHYKLWGGNENLGSIGFAVTEPSLVDGPHFSYLDTRGAARLSGGVAPARFFVTQNAAAPRWALEKVGGFDEHFSGYGFEDMELAFRLEDVCGIQFLVLASPVPLHIHHHTLEAYFEKKVICGQGSLPLVAKLHPDRIKEMRLDYAIDTEKEPPSLQVKVFRWLLALGLGKLACWLVSHWPTRHDHRARAFGLYCQAMNTAILACYRRGVCDSRYAKTLPR